MKKSVILVVLISAIFLFACNEQTKTNYKTVNASLRGEKIDSLEQSNNFYDNVETHKLVGVEIIIEGEIETPGKVDFSKLVKRSLIVKETKLVDSGNKFIGAYRYDGYSLFDILNSYILNKKNSADFPPIVDLYVEIENNKNEKVILSWGELFYPSNIHQIIIATDVARIVPSKTKDLWTLPTEQKLIFAADLFTERNISNPSKISIKSYSGNFDIEKGMSPMFAPEINFSVNDKLIETISEIPNELTETTLHTIFYGRGRGIHSTKPFTGARLKEYFPRHIKLTKENIQQGIFVMVAKDGYRSVYSYSEICNRNDQQDVLLVYNSEDTKVGTFRLFPSSDFFSDRAVKSLDRILYFSKI